MSDKSEWEYAYRRLERSYEEKREECNRLQRQVYDLEAKVRELEPYKKSAERAYDCWALNGEREP